MSEERLKEIKDSINLQYEMSKRYDMDSDVMELLDEESELYNEVIRLKTKTKEQSLLLIDYQDMEQKLEKYKSRIEKAVEYIDQRKDNEFINIQTLLNILKGEK